MIETMLIKEYRKKVSISEPADVLPLCRDLLAGSKKEVFMVLLLDSDNGVIASEIVSVGTLNMTVIHPREIFKLAIIKSANAVIALHNHPSSSLEPSKEDIKITERLAEAGELLGIKLLDHLIVSEDVKTYRSIGP